jgi:two-component system, OmpR family, response regulator
MRHCQSILYVDDDPNICEAVRATLCSITGLDVHTAQSGVMAIDLAYERRPDLVILDFMEPAHEGPSTYERLRGSPLIADTPVIFMLAGVSPWELADLPHSSAIGVVRKPFDHLTLGDELIAMWNKADISHRPGSTRLTGAEGEAKMDSLTHVFLERTRRDVVRLRKLIAIALHGDHSMFEEVARIGHSIRGAGAMLGLPSISEPGATIERLVKEVMSCTPDFNLTIEHAGLQLLQSTELLAYAVDWATRRRCP